MIYVLLPPEWLREENPDLKPIQDEMTLDTALEYNAKGYNVYYYPNAANSLEDTSKWIQGYDIDTFEWCFADMDLKDEKYLDKHHFVEVLFDKIKPTKIVDSGGGIHAYFRVKGLDAKILLRLQRRLCRLLDTDPAICNIKQLMRVPGTVNTKDQNNPRLCELIYESDLEYTAEEMDKLLPAITHEDEQLCIQHYNKTFNIGEQTKVDDRMSPKFATLLRNNKEVNDIWSGEVDDRSKSDYRLGHIMFGNGFTKQEAMSVLVNSPKALSRGPNHRVSYAENIVDKIWTFEIEEDKEKLTLSSSVRDILAKSGDSLKGTRFPCWRYLDDTAHGFRLGQVIGLVAGSGVGKTAIALNAFKGFVQNNPDYIHLYVPLEQPAREIADRWKTMCGEDTGLHDKVHIIDNYAEDGSFRHLSLSDLKEYILKFQVVTKSKIGCVVIDHIGALKKNSADGMQSIVDICHSMKAFAVQTNTLLMMQSQAPREKAGVGDLELNKDAAYGTVFFESYCDYLITVWQPLKRCYVDPKCPTVTAFKFCKIRHKKQSVDKIKEDVVYRIFFDPETETLREMTQTDEHAFDFFANKACNIRKQDRKTEVGTYVSARTTSQSA